MIKKPDKSLQYEHANEILANRRGMKQQQHKKELKGGAQRADAEIELIRAAGSDIDPILATEEPHDEDERELKRATAVAE